MADAPQSSVLPLFLTAGGSSLIGQETANDISQTLMWFTGQWCHCTPPDSVEHFYKAVVTLAVVALGFLVHYIYLKQRSTT